MKNYRCNMTFTSRNGKVIQVASKLDEVQYYSLSSDEQSNFKPVL
jgi:hypothetical protein